MGDSRRMMVMPAEALIPVKRQSGKNQTITMRDVAKSQRILSCEGFDRAEQRAAGALHCAGNKKRIEELAKKLGYRPSTPAWESVIGIFRGTR